MLILKGQADPVPREVVRVGCSSADVWKADGLFAHQRFASRSISSRKLRSVTYWREVPR
jgi:hypothetical protein